MKGLAESEIKKWLKRTTFGLFGLVTIGTGIAFFQYHNYRKEQQLTTEAYKQLLVKIEQEYKRKNKISIPLLSLFQKAVAFLIKDDYLEMVQAQREARRAILKEKVLEKKNANKGDMKLYYKLLMTEEKIVKDMCLKGVQAILEDLPILTEKSRLKPRQYLSLIIRKDSPLKNEERLNLNDELCKLRISEFTKEKIIGENSNIMEIGDFRLLVSLRHEFYKKFKLKSVSLENYLEIKAKIVSDFIAIESGVESEDISYAYQNGVYLDDNGAEVKFSEDDIVDEMLSRYEFEVYQEKMMLANAMLSKKRFK